MTYRFKLLSGLTVPVVMLFLLNIFLGSVAIPFHEVVDFISGRELSEAGWHNILLNFRLPKALAAVMTGAGLSLAGLQMQTLFRNPLAGPFVLGVSSGASLGVALLFLAGVALPVAATSVPAGWLVVSAASMGAGMVLLFVVTVSLRVQDSMALLIVGLMFGSLTGAAISILQYFSTGEEIRVYLFWTFGSLGGLSWGEVKILGMLSLAGMLLSAMAVKPLNAFLLGENYAQSMGVHIRRSRFLIIGSTSLFAGSITAFCGPIAFIGLAVPHLARLAFNTSDHKLLLPAVALTGAAVMLICDMIAQMPWSSAVLPINAVTSMVGAPAVIWIVLRRRRVEKSFGR